MHVGTDLVPIFAECLNKPAMKKLPDSYFTTGIQLLYIIVIPIYAFFFLIGFKPFHIDILMGVDMGQLAFRAAIMASIELVCALFSRMTMLLVRDRLQLNYNQFFIWEFTEGVAIAMFCTLFVWLMDKRTSLYVDLLPTMFLITCSILVFPYIIAGLMSEVHDKNGRIAEYMEKIDKYATGQIGREGSTIPFLDDKNSLKLAVTASTLLYIEAADNYVNICYLNVDRLVKFPLRNSMKAIEEICTANNLARCHRSYYVNLKKVRAIQRTSDGIFAELEYAAAPRIPVSATYADSFIGKYSQING